MKLHLCFSILVTTVELKHIVKINALDITKRTIDTEIKSEGDSNDSNYDVYYDENMDENDSYVDNENYITGETDSYDYSYAIYETRIENKNDKIGDNTGNNSIEIAHFTTHSDVKGDSKKSISNIKSEKRGTENRHSNKNLESGVLNKNGYNNNEKEKSNNLAFHSKILKSNGQEGDPCRNHYECSYEYENYLCQWRLGAEEGKCRRKSCRSNNDCKLFTDFPSKCQRGHCRIKFCYGSGECPKGFGCIDMICKQILGKCEYDCDCGDNNVICRKNFCYLRPGAKCKKNIFLQQDVVDYDKRTDIADTNIKRDGNNYVKRIRSGKGGTENEVNKDDFIDNVVSNKNKESRVHKINHFNRRNGQWIIRGHKRNEFNSHKNEKYGISGFHAERRNGNGQEGDTCTNHYECSYEYENYLCQWKVGAEEGKCRRKSCRSNNDCRLFTDFPSKCQSGHCRIKFCYGNGQCPEGFGCFDMICKQILGTCEYDCDCGKRNVACYKKFCYFKVGKFNCGS